MTPTVQSITDLLTEFWDEETLEQIARDTHFVQRQPAVNGAVFAQAMVFGCLEKSAPTVSHWAQVCLDLGVEISPQGFDQRFTEYSSAFMEHLFRESLAAFRSQVALPLAVLAQFTAVNLVDSTYISLPASLAALYPGSGGSASPAGLKIQLMLDFLHERLAHIAVRSGREPDQAYSAYRDAVGAGSLNLMDLGYFCLDHLATVSREKHAYWLSRYLYGTTVYTAAGEELELLTTLRATAANRLELEIQLGATHRLPCRLIAVRAPQEVADRRRQHAKEPARQKGRTPSADYLALLAWTLFVTNVPAAMLTGEQVMTLYRVRWQVELIFKLWKSYAGLARVAGRRKSRVLTELYAKLVGLVLTHFLLAPLRGQQWTGAPREVSRVQVRQIFQRFARDLNRALGAAAAVQATLTELWQHLRRLAFKQRRVKQPNIESRLALLAAALDVPEITEITEDLQFPLP
jgi:hypothetical protein